MAARLHRLVPRHLGDTTHRNELADRLFEVAFGGVEPCGPGAQRLTRFDGPQHIVDRLLNLPVFGDEDGQISLRRRQLAAQLFLLLFELRFALLHLQNAQADIDTHRHHGQHPRGPPRDLADLEEFGGLQRNLRSLGARRQPGPRGKLAPLGELGGLRPRDMAPIATSAEKPLALLTTRLDVDSAVPIFSHFRPTCPWQSLV